MAARKEARARGEIKQDEFVYVDFNGNFTDTPPDPAEKEQISLDSIIISPTKKDEVDDRVNGKVTFYDDEKGFGFIRCNEDSKDYFCHFRDSIN